MDNISQQFSQGYDYAPLIDENKKIFVLTSEPLPNISVHDIRDWLTHNNSIQNIVDAYVVTHEKYICVEDNVYDYETDTTKYANARLTADEWFLLMEELQKQIFDAMRSEGYTIPEKGNYYAMIPFMKRFGYRSGNGWWIKEKALYSPRSLAINLI